MGFSPPRYKNGKATLSLCTTLVAHQARANAIFKHEETRILFPPEMGYTQGTCIMFHSI